LFEINLECLNIFENQFIKEERQNIVEILTNDTELRQNLIDNYLKRFPDFQKIEWRFTKKKANLQDCYKIYMAVETLPHMFESMIRHEGKNAFLIRDMFTNPLNVN
jgi:DNA mismatch repair protein MSH2